MMWPLGTLGRRPRRPGALARYDGPQIGGQNMARFKLPAFDAIYERLEALPDGPERDALFIARRAAWRSPTCRTSSTCNRIVTDMALPAADRLPPAVFWQDWWQYVDIDDGEPPQPQARA